MMTRDELYGGSVDIEYTSSNETVIMPDGTDVRVWLLFDLDIMITDSAIRMPDPLSIRSASGLAPDGSGSAGGPIFYIINFGLTSVNLEDSTGNVLGFLAFRQVFVVSLFNAFVPGGQWCLIKKDIESGFAGITDQTVSFGTETMPNDQVRAYSYEEDVWESRQIIPPLGDPFAATAVDTIEPAFGNTWTGVLFNFVFLEFSDTMAGGSYNVRDAPTYEAANTGIADSTGGESGTSTLDDCFYVSNGALNPVPRATEKYGILSDLWSAGPPTPSGVNAWGPCTTCDEGFKSPSNTAIFICPGEPDSATGWYAVFLVSQAYIILPSPPWPWGHTSNSIVGVSPTMHLQNGNYDFTGTPNPGFSTDAHYEFSKFTISWSALPRSPVVARGMGIRGTSLYLDRYTFGMGADKDHPGTFFFRHIEYNIETRSYRERAVTTWGDSDHREGAWARMEAFDQA